MNGISPITFIEIKAFFELNKIDYSLIDLQLLKTLDSIFIEVMNNNPNEVRGQLK